MENSQQTPQKNLQNNLRGFIQNGHIIPAGKNTVNHTRLEATVNGKTKIFLVDEMGRVYDPKTGRDFTLRQ
jgi:hypothetical protein